MKSTKQQECVAPEIAEEHEEQKPALVEIKSATMLNCELTPSELVDVAAKAMKKQREIDGYVAEKKASVAHYTELIRRATEERDDLASKFLSGTERRLVDTVWKLNDPTPGMKRFYRLDTGAVIGIEEMTSADREQMLPGIEDEFPEEQEEQETPEFDAEESAENARVDAIIDNLKDDDEEPKGDF